MPLRRLNRLIGAVLVGSLAIAAGDGLLCLIPCAASTVQGEGGPAIEPTGQKGHCATQGAPQTRSSSSAQPHSACATDQAIGEWTRERARSRTSVDAQTGEAFDTVSHRRANTPASVTAGHRAASSSPPGVFVPLRI